MKDDGLAVEGYYVFTSTEDNMVVGTIPEVLKLINID